MREEPAFGTTTGWDIISSLDDEHHNVSFASSPAHGADVTVTVTPPMSPRTNTVSAPNSPGVAGLHDNSVHQVQLGHQGDLGGDHLSSVYCTSNGRVSLRPMVDDLFTLDPLCLSHSMAGVSKRRPLKYPYSAKGLPTAQDVSAPVLRTKCELSVDGCTLKRCVRRKHTLHMDTGVVAMDATFAYETELSHLERCGNDKDCSSPDRPAAQITTRRFASLVDADTAVLEVTIRLERIHHGAAVGRSYPVRFAIESLVDVEHWRVISSTSSASPEDDTDAALSEESQLIKAVLASGVGPHAVVESRITVGCVKACGNASVGAATQTTTSSSNRTTPHPIGSGMHRDPHALPATTIDLGSGSQTSASKWAEQPSPVENWTVVGRKVVEGTLQADGKSHISVYAIFRHRRRHSESALEPAHVPWPWADESCDHDPVMLEEAHKTAVSRFWHANAPPIITTQISDASSPHRFTAALRFSIYTMLCNCSGVGEGFPLTSSGLTADGLGGQCNLSHASLHGEMLVRTAPWLARNYLMSIIGMLPRARLNAQNHYVGGALFPAQTIDGADCVPYFVNSAPRIHVSCDVALFALSYLRTCTAKGLASLADDPKFQVGIAHIIIETALAVMDFGEFDAVASEFRLDGVTGPDEYNPLVDDHFYTLVVARAHLQQVADLLEPGSAIYEDDMLMAAFQDLNLEELHADAKAYAASIVLRRDNATKAYLAHPCFDTLPPFPAIDRGLVPLSRRVHPLVIYKHKVVQIPEVLLAMLRYRHEFAFEDICTSAAYYKPTYTRDVNWALGIEAAADLVSRGDLTPSTHLLEALLTCSLDQTMSETPVGLELAPLASAWAAIVFGLIGLHEVPNGELWVDPALPLGWKSVSLPLHHQGSWFKVTVLPREATYEHLSGPPLRLRHGRNATPVFLNSRHQVRSVPRPVASEVRPCIDGGVVLLDAIVEDFHLLNFQAWRAVLDEFFTMVVNARALDQIAAAPSGSGSRAPRPFSSGASPLSSVDDLSVTQGLASPSGESMLVASPSDDGLPKIAPLTLEEYVATFLCAQQHGGQLQYAGLEVVLRSRGIDLPLGCASDAVARPTRFGLANAKLDELKSIMSSDDQQLNFIPGVEHLLKSCHDQGVRIAVVTFSRSADDLLSRLPDIRPWVSSVINGVEARAMRVKGRPHPDLFIAAAERLHVLPSRCFVLGSELERGFYPNAFDQFAAAINVRWSPEDYAEKAVAGTGDSLDSQAQMLRTNTLPPCVLPSAAAEGGGSVATPNQSATQPPSPSSRGTARNADSPPHIRGILARHIPQSLDELEQLTQCD